MTEVAKQSIATCWSGFLRSISNHISFVKYTCWGNVDVEEVGVQ